MLAGGHDELSVYGVGKQRPIQDWRILARALLHQGLVDETQDGYPVLSLNAASWQVMRSELPVRIAVAAKPRARPTRASAGTSAAALEAATGAEVAASPNRDALFERLRALRKRLADEQSVPPYVIFHDATLREMSERRPLTLGQFAGLRGVGEAKLARYGELFIAAMREPSE